MAAGATWGRLCLRLNCLLATCLNWTVKELRWKFCASFEPRVILVETHGLYGARTNLVALLLENRGYIVSDLGPAEHNDHCEKLGIRVLLGINNKRRHSQRTP